MYMCTLGQWFSAVNCNNFLKTSDKTNSNELIIVKSLKTYNFNKVQQLFKCWHHTNNKQVYSYY